jgi:predicted small metal-binding protein
MYEHSCKKAGADLCGFTAKAGTESELRAALDAHVKAKHRVNGMTDTIYGYLRATASR